MAAVVEVASDIFETVINTPEFLTEQPGGFAYQLVIDVSALESGDTLGVVLRDRTLEADENTQNWFSSDPVDDTYPTAQWISPVYASAWGWDGLIVQTTGSPRELRYSVRRIGT